MGVYRVAEVCPNGHVSTYAADVNPELREKFCSRCGEATMTACASCRAPIRGDYHVEGVVGFGGGYEPPAFCHNCGKRFPWTERKVEAAVELVEVDAKLSPAEIPNRPNRIDKGQPNDTSRITSLQADDGEGRYFGRLGRPRYYRGRSERSGEESNLGQVRTRMMENDVFTVGDLRRQLQGLNDNDRLTFAGGLTFYRIKRVADYEFFVEFNEAQGDLSPAFIKRNPNVKVVFLDTAKANWDQSGVIGVIDAAVR